MTFDVSKFSEIGAWLFQTGKSIFESFNFNFGDFTLNGWAILIGVAIFCIVCFIIRRLSE